jgi:hypothetical protein
VWLITELAAQCLVFVTRPPQILINKRKFTALHHSIGTEVSTNLVYIVDDVWGRNGISFWITLLCKTPGFLVEIQSNPSYLKKNISKIPLTYLYLYRVLQFTVSPSKEESKEETWTHAWIQRNRSKWNIKSRWVTKRRPFHCCSFKESSLNECEIEHGLGLFKSKLFFSYILVENLGESFTTSANF